MFDSMVPSPLHVLRPHGVAVAPSHVVWALQVEATGTIHPVCDDHIDASDMFRHHDSESRASLHDRRRWVLHAHPPLQMHLCWHSRYACRRVAHRILSRDNAGSSAEPRPHVKHADEATCSTARRLQFARTGAFCDCFQSGCLKDMEKFMMPCLCAGRRSTFPDCQSRIRRRTPLIREKCLGMFPQRSLTRKSRISATRLGEIRMYCPKENIRASPSSPS